MVTLVTGNSNMDESEHPMKIKHKIKVIVRTSNALLSTRIGTQYQQVPKCKYLYLYSV